MKKFSRKVRKAVRVLCSRELVLAKRENEKLAYKVQKLEMELDNSTDTIASMSKANKNLKKQIEFLDAQVKTLTSSNIQLEHEKQNYYVALGVRTKECNDLKNSLCDAIGESERRYDKIVELTQKAENIQKKLDEVSKPWYKKWFKC